MKNRIKVIIALLVFGFLIVGCGDKDSKKISRNESEIKTIMEKEEEYIGSEHVYAQYYSVSDYNKVDFDIEWIDNEETINIKGTIVNGYVANNEANDSAIILGKDGTLYRKKNNDYAIIKSNESIKRIGLYYPHEGGHDVCNSIIEFVLETDSGIHLVSFEDNGVIISSKTIEKGDFELPLCYGSENSSFSKYLNINVDGEIGFDKKNIVDKVTSKPLKVNHVIYVSVDSKEKYYVITEDNVLYILEDDKTSIEAIAKVDIKVEKSEDDKDVQISISYGDNVLSLKNVVNSSI